MIVTDRAVGKALTTLEQHFHDAGWDNSRPAVYVLSQVAPGRVYPGIPISLPGGVAPGEALADAAMSMWSQPDMLPSGGITASAARAFVGWCFVAEAYMADGTNMSRAELEAYERGEGGSLMDRVGSREMRMAFAADTSDRVVSLNRVRGQAPVVKVGSSQRAEFTGRIPAALRLMTLAAARHLPANGHALGSAAELDLRGHALFEKIRSGRTMDLPDDLGNTRP